MLLRLHIGTSTFFAAHKSIGLTEDDAQDFVLTATGTEEDVESTDERIRMSANRMMRAALVLEHSCEGCC